jgi:hypothetical protein
MIADALKGSTDSELRVTAAVCVGRAVREVDDGGSRAWADVLHGLAVAAHEELDERTAVLAALAADLEGDDGTAGEIVG